MSYNFNRGRGVVLRGITRESPRILKIGDNVTIGDDVQIFCDELVIGDYVTIHRHTLIAGYEPCHIGHNSWVGQNAVLNSTGGLYIGRGVGIGAYTQLWTHIKHGDTLQGCRWDSAKPMHIGDDAWFVGRCTVSPVNVGAKAVAMLGSVVTRDMEPNRVYGGCPAVDLTEKMGEPFLPVSDEQKWENMQTLLKAFEERYPESRGYIRLVKRASEIDEKRSDFAVLDRVYNKRLIPEETRFMRFIYPVKFFPVDLTGDDGGDLWK